MTYHELSEAYYLRVRQVEDLTVQVVSLSVELAQKEREIQVLRDVLNDCENLPPEPADEPDDLKATKL